MDLVLACFLNPSGLSRAAREFYKIFSRNGFRIVPVWLMEPSPSGVDKQLVENMLSASGRPVDDAPVELHVGLPHALRSFKGASAILGSCVFENNRLTQEQISACRSMDAVLAPSYFCRNACLGSGIKRYRRGSKGGPHVFYLPYPMDSLTWNTWVEPSSPKEGYRFRFLYLNSWYQRKGYDVLMRAWWEEFSKDDPVELCVKSYRENDRPMPVGAHLDIMARELGYDRRREAPVKVVDRIISDENLPAFMRSYDCYVSPHRSEGFGMNAWYSMALGIPVICSNYGGVTDFAKGDTSWLVDCPGTSKPSREEVASFPHLDGITWAEPSVESLRRQMRECLANPAEREQRAANAHQFVHSSYAPGIVLDLFREALEAVSPGSWEQLNWTKAVEALASQPSPRFESTDKAIKMMEI